MLQSAEDFDKEIDRLRQLRSQMFDADSYDKAETDALLEQIMQLQEQKADWVQASNLASGDTRLTNMLMSNNVTDVAKATNEILDNPELGLPESHWNGEVRLMKPEEMPKRSAGCAHFWDGPNGAKDGSIDIREGYLHDYSTMIHENLHQRSRGDLLSADLMYEFPRYRPIEEGTVQLMTEEVCTRLGYTPRKTYQSWVNALRDFHRIIEPKVSDYEFAQHMIDKSMRQRYNYVMTGIDEYRSKHPNMRQATKDTLAQIEAVFAVKE